MKTKYNVRKSSLSFLRKQESRNRVCRVEYQESFVRRSFSEGGRIEVQV